MRTRLSSLALASLLLATSQASAFDVPPLRARVTDTAGMLRPEQARALESRLAEYEQTTGHQFALLAVPALEGESIEEVAVRAFEAWKLGDARRDDGLLLLVALRDRRVRIEVGYGLEGAIPDAVAARVIREVIAPAFRAGDYAGGVSRAFDVLMDAGRGEAVGPAIARHAAPRREAPSFLVIVWVVFLFFLLVGRRRRGLFFGGPGGFFVGGGSHGGFGRGGFGGGGFGGGGGRSGGGGASGGW